MYRFTPFSPLCSLRLARQTLLCTSVGLALVLLPALSGCQSPPSVTDPISNLETPSIVYKIEIVQGNFVSSEQVAALRTGMPKAQVKNILGTPLLTDIFHLDRWDYVFTISKGGKAQPPRKLTVFFKGESLDRWEGDAMPSETEFVKTLTSGRKLEKIPPLEASERQLTEFAKRENAGDKTDASVTAASTSTAATPARPYPPLESR